MILYGLALAPLAKEIREAVPDAMQAWYADDCGMAGWRNGTGGRGHEPTGKARTCARILPGAGKEYPYMPSS
jgi:hypothetical protein